MGFAVVIVYIKVGLKETDEPALWAFETTSPGSQTEAKCVV